MLTDSENLSTARALQNDAVPLINVDELDPALSDANLELRIDPDDFAYIRYTSGSTGTAKGAVKTHRHVLHAVMNLTNDFHICADDRILLLGRETLGKHAFEALLNGATLCPFDVKRDGVASLAQRFSQEAITICKFFQPRFAVYRWHR